jgi:hypothetical protein
MRLLLAILALAIAGACGPGPHRPATQGRPVLDLARKAVEPNANGGLSSEANLVGLARVPVAGHDFETASRAAKIERFPCSRCHDRPVEQMKLAAKGRKAAHWEIELKHAPAGVMSCESCHNLNADTDSLHTLRGDAVAFDHSYQLCAQCHSRQLADWKGGAHGKRLGGWAPPRVVQSCTGCHNPHEPHFKSRWPSVSAPVAAGAAKHE